MEIRNRLFTYPVLCNDNDDYIDSEFHATCDVKEELSDLILNFEFVLNNNIELEWLIREGLAQYVVHVECTYTSFRTVIRSSGNTMTIRVLKSKVNNEVSLLGAIVASKKIVEFRSASLNEDYKDTSISFDRGEILAYYNMPKIHITKNYEELAGNNSFFTIIKRVKQETNEQNPVSYDIECPKIKIIVDEEIYNGYAKYCNNTNIQTVYISLLILPAIVFMVDTLRNQDLDRFKSQYWYQKISKACRLQGKDFIDDYVNSDLNCADVAQMLLHNPINNAFTGLERIIEEE